MTNPAIKFGLLYGLVSLLFTLIIYLVSPKLMFSFSVMMLIGLAIMIFFMVAAGREEKANNEGYMSYAEALKTTFIVFLIGSFISTVFQYVLFTYIDPSLVDLLRDTSIETAQSVAKLFGADENALEQVREQAMEQEYSMTISKSLFNWVTGLIFGLIIALIVSIFIKKKAENV